MESWLWAMLQSCSFATWNVCKLFCLKFWIETWKKTCTKNFIKIHLFLKLMYFCLSCKLLQFYLFAGKEFFHTVTFHIYFQFYTKNFYIRIFYKFIISGTKIFTIKFTFIQVFFSVSFDLASKCFVQAYTITIIYIDFVI